MNNSKFQLSSHSKPSLRRLFKLFVNKENLSILRTLEYEEITALASKGHFRGSVLDYGGGKNANYTRLFKTVMANATYESVNIDKSMEPTYLISENNLLPTLSKKYETVISLNTFEHIYDIESTLREIHRVLKHRGELIAFVPFLYVIHGHPDDFFRGTPSWWGKKLEDIGFVDVAIKPISWGPFSTGLALSGSPGPFKKIRAMLALTWDIAWSAFTTLRAANVYKTKDQKESIVNPLGLLILAIKP